MYPALLACFHLPSRKRSKHSASEHCRRSLKECEGISLKADKNTNEGVRGGPRGLKEDQNEGSLLQQSRISGRKVFGGSSNMVGTRLVRLSY